MEPYTLRPRVFGQHLRFLRSAVFIDCYLYSQGNGALVLEIQYRRKGSALKPDAVRPIGLALNVFGLWEAMEPPATYDNASALNVWQHFPRASSIQKRQLAALVSALARDARANTPGRYASLVLHCLKPRGCDPCEGLVNHYIKSGRAARDVELARRAKGLDKV